jgi:hypothetical protein
LEFDWTAAFLGQTIARKARIIYEHPHEWAYYDLRKVDLAHLAGSSVLS